MNQQSDLLEGSGLCFFGEMSAANAHEIKNALAVINENAGLLEDFIVLAEKGIPLDLSRLKRLAGAIKQQVSRADHIAKSTNRFAHSVDQGQEVADLEQSLILITDMATRFATLRNVHLQVAKTHASITLPVRPFTLLHLLWLCLHASIKACETGQVLTVTAKKIKGAVEISYGPLLLLKDSFVLDLKASPEMMTLLYTLDGALRINSNATILTLTLKKNNHKS
jgi:signal transduction histidine kinase